MTSTETIVSGLHSLAAGTSCRGLRLRLSLLESRSWQDEIDEARRAIEESAGDPADADFRAALDALGRHLDAIDPSGPLRGQ